VPCVLSPGTGFRLYATEDGYIRPMVRLGQSVQAGDCIAELTSPEIELLSTETAGVIQAGTARIAAVASIRNPTSELRLSLPVTEQLVSAATKRMRKLEEISTLLRIHSPRDGVVIPARNVPETPETDDITAPSWTGQPLSLVNGGAWLARQTHLCTIAVPSDFRVVCLVPQNETEFVEVRAAATVVFLSGMNKPVSAVVTHLRGAPEDTVDRELALNGIVAVTDPDTLKPREKLFAIELSPLDSSQLPPVYSTGHARIQCLPISMVSRIWRFLRASFSDAV